MLDDDCKENISYELLNSKLVNFCCEICLKHLNAIMETTIKTLPLPLNSTCQMPLVSINIVDTDNNLNICMCKERGDEVMIVDDDDASEKENICPNCRNIIKAQPSERYSLVSKQTMLGDVLVNRIDSQFLSSTYCSSQSQVKKLRDPYTPESIESHSPQTELDEPTYINNTDCDDIPVILRDAINNKTELSNGEFDSDETEKIQNHHHNQMVSPLQLSTRLEILRRESQLECSSSKKSGSDDSHTKSSKSCCKCTIS